MSHTVSITILSAIFMLLTFYLNHRFKPALIRRWPEWLGRIAAILLAFLITLPPFLVVIRVAGLQENNWGYLIGGSIGIFLKTLLFGDER